MNCPYCGYAAGNGHEPMCIGGYTVEPPKPPAVDTRETSREAYASISDELPHLEAVVETFVRACPAGATDDEIELGTGLSHQCASARRNALVAKGLLVNLLDDDGNPVKRLTRSGRRAFVWAAIRSARRSAA